MPAAQKQKAVAGGGVQTVTKISSSEFPTATCTQKLKAEKTAPKRSSQFDLTFSGHMHSAVPSGSNK